MAQERPQSILRSLEEVSSYQRCVCLCETWEINLSCPCPESPKIPPSFSLSLPVPFCLPGIDGNGKSPSKAELRHLYLTEKYVWRWKQFLSRRGKRTSPLDLKLGHNNWLRQVSDSSRAPRPAALPLGAERLPTFALLSLPSLRFLASFQMGSR